MSVTAGSSSSASTSFSNSVKRFVSLGVTSFSLR